MSEIKIGEYVRTKKDGICKLLQIDEDNMWCGYVDKPFWLRKDNIVKHSPNIIDLIEEGDYVNGEKVSNVDKIGNTIFIEWENGNTYSTDIVNNKFIYSIVTKEQFQSVEYRLGE